MIFFRALAERVFRSRPQPYEERYYNSSDGLKLYYRDYEGPSGRTPVLCIPGLTRNSRDFDFIAAHMARSRRIIVADLRGRGKSEHAKDPRHYVVAIEAADMVRLLEDAGIGKIMALGTSRGGIVAMTMAATRPDILEGAMLNDIGGEIEARGLSRILEFVGREPPMPDWEAATAALKRSLVEAFPGVDDARWLAFAHALYHEEKRQIIPDYDPRLGDAMRESIAGLSPEGPNIELWPLFTVLAQRPVLVLRGKTLTFYPRPQLKKCVG